ncbi:MAG: hypothetical protein KBD01_14960, partial [Acidobacteria bacterium]|nr:hypothetical protein [Acidobacteriota bacterium]
AMAEVWYRATGDAGWRQGPPMLRVDGEPAGIDGWICGNLFAGSVLDLESGRGWDVRIVLSDPDGVSGAAERTFSAATRAVPPHPRGTRTLHVYTSCGTGRLQPCYSDLVAAARDAQPGEVVFIHAGTYVRGPMDLGFLSSRATTEATPIVFRGESMDAVVFDGGVPPGRGNSQSYFLLTGTKHLHFERFTVQNAGTVFSARDAVGLTVRSVRMNAVYAGVGGASSPAGKDRGWNILDNEVIGWNPAWYPYGGANENSISHTGIRVYGKGHAVENNTVGRFWDCIAHSDTGGGQITNASVDWRNPPSVSNDIAANELYECYDDGLSADYGFHNIRILRNRVTNAHTALSAQPFYGGPAYFIGNAAYNMAANSFKFHNQPAGIEAYHNTLIVHDYAFESDAGWPNARLFNNLLLANPATSSIAVGTGAVQHPLTALDHNGYSGSNGSRMIDWNRAPYGASDRHGYVDLPAFFAGEGFEQHGLEVTYAEFAGAAYPAGEGSTYPVDDADLALRSSARAIDAGRVLPGINDGYAGAAPDLGAFERGAPPRVFGVRPQAAEPPGEVRGLTLRREGSGYRLAWTAPQDGGPAQRYALVATPLGVPFDGTCEADLGGGTSAYLPSLSANRGFLVGARNDGGEGTLGADSDGGARPPLYGPDLCP